MTDQVSATDALTDQQLAGVEALLRGIDPDLVPDKLSASLLSGGRSNLTFRLDTGAAPLILRRPPLGHVLETAHDMGREYRVMSALHPTGYPVPKTVCHIEDSDLLGAPFYVMHLVEGTVFRDDDDLARLNPADAEALSFGFIDALADLHLIDYDAVGLSTYGRPANYLERQMNRWTKQLAASKSREVEGFEELGARLSARVPSTARSTIVHGDFRLDNAIIDEARPGTVRAILDWELSTLGDPLTDLGLFYLYWQGWSGLDNPIAGTPADISGYPSWETLVERYSERTGTRLQHFSWYRAFAIFKFTVICEGIHYRFSQGATVGPGFERIGQLVPPLVARGLEILDDDS
ncbi:acyl-CoA dehydrogenase [Mycolicibacterium chitae]|uniref:Phosphotransferase enzyme family protein n=1 Tax=Mycolicibacterium chitae TaxID=1792 RepID=A0A448IDR2_MYCCI|nr:phosphotransferase family protein [Mycolicibacterium chitae]MCV7106065.1 phosphotransferase family protein [Mycolicibacterium chitae]BBZ01746.1 acyl-CoA dehydrogenase [Mycolicibacterium chitae]VEG50581.1 phosphotransferase enzyme family protein [Mycolicibacterium chitae]